MDDGSSQTIMVVTGLLTLLGAAVVVVLYLRWRHKLKHWTPVRAIVTRAWTEVHAGSGNPDEGGGRVHYAEYTFTTVDGHTHQGKGKTKKEHAADDVIEIRHHPHDPDRNQAGFVDAGVWYVAGLPVFLLLAGIGVLALLDGLSVIDLS